MRIDPRPAAALAAGLLLTLAPSVAAQPSCPSVEARAYDFWIGEWDVDNANRSPASPDAGLVPTGAGTDRVHAILGGCAIVEHWEGALTWDHVLGFSVRAYDAEREKWVAVLNWPGPAGPSFTVFRGAFEGGEGNLRGERWTPEGTIRSWFRFVDVEDDAFRWIGARARGEEPYREFWTMDFRRRDPVTDAALVNGPTRRIAERCSDPRARALDFAIGDWAGEETLVAGEEETTTRPIRIRAWSIMEGCAVTVLEGGGEGEPEDAFAVAAYVPDLGRWVAFSIRREEPVFRRWDGPSEPSGDGTLVSGGLMERAAAGDPFLRVEWTSTSADRLRRVISRSDDDGATWRTLSTAELDRR